VSLHKLLTKDNIGTKPFNYHEIERVEYTCPANLIVDVTHLSDTVEAESESNVTFTSRPEGSKQRRSAISALRYTSDAPESRSNF